MNGQQQGGEERAGDARGRLAAQRIQDDNARQSEENRQAAQGKWRIAKEDDPTFEEEIVEGRMGVARQVAEQFGGRIGGQAPGERFVVT